MRRLAVGLVPSLHIHCSGEAGLLEADLVTLLRRIDDMAVDRPERTLRPFLLSDEPDSGTLRALPATRGFLSSLASGAPACQTLRPTAFEAVQALLSGRRLSLLDLDHMQGHCPVLGNFLEPYMKAPQLHADVAALLEALLKVNL